VALTICMSLSLSLCVAAMSELVNTNKKAVFACVMDSYDYDQALNVLLPKVAQSVIEHGMVVIVCALLHGW
jgi:hypothetical protein